MSVAALLEAKWRTWQQQAKTHASVIWHAYQVSPPFPSRWPPVTGIQLYYYVYAFGNYGENRRHVVDGHLVSWPWACLRKPLGPEVQPDVEFLQEELQLLGIQGFRPLNDSEKAILKSGTQIEQAFGKLMTATSGTEPEYEFLKRYYRTWLKLNGVIGQQIGKFHATFFEWIKS
jgi:hypothetical protein